MADYTPYKRIIEIWSKGDTRSANYALKLIAENQARGWVLVEAHPRTHDNKQVTVYIMGHANADAVTEFENKMNEGALEGINQARKMQGLPTYTLLPEAEKYHESVY